MKKTFSNDKTYVSHAVLSYGDYDNSCAVERANVRVLREAHPGFERYSFSSWDQAHRLEYSEATKRHEWLDILPESEIVELYGGYGSTAIWIREDVDEENGYLADLENYPCLDDDVVSEIEAEILTEVVELKNNKPAFPLSFYDNAEDMLDHRDATGQGITTEEAREILKYAAELERRIETVLP